ncbi:hypothetical protein Pcinc_013043 [Petrolisthes cinctipes]|uniref:Uncharacterized protein n=1 Tax=Petrolisthes cinctipes TaxID=88211 RepID=A0AAE1FZG1_PETCI|nr:hypothetical protein Pcinc_013043 [Petrolisthes cinctipes]
MTNVPSFNSEHPTLYPTRLDVQFTASTTCINLQPFARCVIQMDLDSARDYRVDGDSRHMWRPLWCAALHLSHHATRNLVAGHYSSTTRLQTSGTRSLEKGRTVGTKEVGTGSIETLFSNPANARAQLG